MVQALPLTDTPVGTTSNVVTFGVCATWNARVDKETRQCCRNIIEIIANVTRNTFGVERNHLDMKSLADMLKKKVYDREELKALRAWIGGHLQNRLDLSQVINRECLDRFLSIYVIMRNLLKDLNTVGGAYMNQLEWGSDLRGLSLPIRDFAENLIYSTFDHNGPKDVLPFGIEADMQGTLTMLFTSWLSGGNPPLFMDFCKVWEPWKIQAKARELGVVFTGEELWAQKGIVNGFN